MAKVGKFEDGSSVLTTEEEAAVAAEAIVEVEAEIKARVKNALKAKVKREKLISLQGERMKGEPVEEVYLDLPPFGQVLGYGMVVLDGKRYDHGRTHKVPASVAAVLRDQMQHAWRHDAEIKGQTNPVEYRRARVNKVAMGRQA